MVQDLMEAAQESARKAMSQMKAVQQKIETKKHQLKRKYGDPETRE